MGHKPWDRPWKRAEKAKAKREWQIEVWRDDLDGGWVAAYPADSDLPGCMSQGETVSEVLRSLAQAKAEIEALTDETRDGFADLTQKAHRILHRLP